MTEKERKKQIRLKIGNLLLKCSVCKDKQCEVCPIMGNLAELRKELETTPGPIKKNNFVNHKKFVAEFDKKTPVKEIMEKLKVSETTVYAHLKRYNKARGIVPKKPISLETLKELINAGLKNVEIANLLKVDQSSISRRVKRYGLREKK
jgi:DNA-binding MarR family transcriptional regulator